MKTLLKDLNWKFGIVLTVLLTTIMIAEQSLLLKQARIGMESRLSEKATFINTFYAFLIADALQRKDDVTLLQVINRLEEDPEILSVVVVDDKEEIRYHADSDKLGTTSTDSLILKSLQTGDGVMNQAQNAGGRALVLVSPLKVQGVARPLGAVRIEFTYRHVQDQLAKFDSSFHLALIGFISAGVGFLMIFIYRWVTLPVENVEKTVAGFHLTTAEPNLPESSDEFGRLNKALNDMVLRFKAELLEQVGTDVANPGALEKDLVERILQSFFPKDLLIVANKDNKIVSQTKEGLPVSSPSDHLLDLITDKDFANLVGPAYQQEGKVMRGPVLFQDQPYEATVFCVPDNQSKTIKTVIVLQAQLNKGDA